MLGLEAVGALERTSVFPPDSLSAELVKRVVRFESAGGKSYDLEASYIELIEPLRKRGRDDLAGAIQQQLARPHGSGVRGSRKVLAAFDKKYLRGTLSRLKKF
jgi:hypothetical protein